jgi:hypothetical protein
VRLALRIAIVSGEPGQAACVHDRFTITAARVPSTNRMLIYDEPHLQSVLGEYAPGHAFAVPAPDPRGPGVISCNCRSAQRQEMVFVNLFDVRIHAIRHRRNRRRPFEVRWHAADRSRSKSFITRRLADSYRAELVRAARKGLEFDPVTGEPVLWAAPQPAATTWYRHALAYTDMKWRRIRARAWPRPWPRSPLP